MNYIKTHKITLLAALGVVLYYFRFTSASRGISYYPLAAECLLDGRPLTACWEHFTYPPAFALVMTPFLLLPLWLRTLVWYVLSISILYKCFMLCESMVSRTLNLRIEGRQLFLFRFFSLALSFKFILAVLGNQSYDFLILFLVLLGLRGLLEHRSMLTALGFSSAAALKATPLIFFPLFVLKKEWKVVCLSVGLFFFFSFLPDILFSPKNSDAGYFVTWLQSIAHSGLTEVGSASNGAFFSEENELNQSLRAFVFRGSVLMDLEHYYHGLAFLTFGIFLLLVAWSLYSASLLRNVLVFEVSILLIAALMLSPMTSKSHFVSLLLPYMLIVGHMFKEKKVPVVMGSLLLISFILGTLTSKGILGREFSTIALQYGCVSLSTMLVLILLFMILNTMRRQRVSDGLFSNEDALESRSLDMKRAVID
jgi:hypothetical protein